jgi:hypothetical protein
MGVERQDFVRDAEVPESFFMPAGARRLFAQCYGILRGVEYVGERG